LSFNQDIGNWYVASVTNMSSMFYSNSGGTAFNQDIGNWNVSNVTNMSSMFTGAASFNQDLGNWDVSNVTNMSSMFAEYPGYDSAFNNAGTSTIRNWNTSKVTDMSGMFFRAGAFNQDISSWNVASTALMNSMFNSATSFNQNLANWNVTNVTTMDYMFTGVTLSTSNYSNTLVGWSTQSLQNNVTLVGGSSQYYTGAPATARANIIASHSWTISDGGIYGDDPTSFISTWDTTNTSTGSSNSDQIKLPLVSNGTYNFTVDYTPPTILLLAPDNNTFIGSSLVNFSYVPTDNLLGIASCSLIINSSVNMTNLSVVVGQANWFVQSLAEGVYSWTVNCSDSVWNQGTNTSERRIYVDLTPPLPTLTTANKTWFSNSTPNLTFTLTDNYDSIINFTFYVNDTINLTGYVSNGAATGYRYP